MLSERVRGGKKERQTFVFVLFWVAVETVAVSKQTNKQTNTIQGIVAKSRTAQKCITETDVLCDKS